MKILSIMLLLFSLQAAGQELKVEFDKKHDFSIYKTFSFGESQVATPPDEKQVTDATIDKWVKAGTARELKYKGLKRVDTLGDLVVTYTIVTMPRLDIHTIGPAAGTPDSNDRTWSRSYTQQNFIIDLTAPNNNYLAWRINALNDVVGRDAERVIDAIIVRGFKKFHKQKRKQKK